MPELPEMENYRRLLEEHVVNKPISKIIINREKSINVQVTQFQQSVQGQVLTKIERKAKHLLFHLSNDSVLLLHLMLGGWMYFGDQEDKPARTTQVQLEFGGKILYFIGLRLGYLHLYRLEDANERLAKLGPEPLEAGFTLHLFRERFHKRRGVLKTKLIDQEFLSGIGNCYSDEICFDAAILPIRDVSDLTEDQLTRLYNSMRKILLEAIEKGGYMSNPFMKTDNKTGGYDPLCKVYDREGESCFRCGSKVVKDMISSRKTFYCNQCQV